MSEGKHYKFERFEYFAVRGMVTLIDTEAAQDTKAAEDTYTFRIAPGDFLKRAIGALVQEPDKNNPDKLRRLRKLVEDAAVVCKEAKAQGDPTDNSVIESVIRHQRKRSIVMPHELPPIQGLSGVNYKLEDKKTASDILTTGINTIPDFTLSPTDTALAKKLKI